MEIKNILLLLLFLHLSFYLPTQLKYPLPRQPPLARFCLKCITISRNGTNIVASAVQPLKYPCHVGQYITGLPRYIYAHSGSTGVSR